MSSQHAEMSSGERPGLDRRLTRRDWLAQTGGGLLAIEAASVLGLLDGKANAGAAGDETEGTLIVRNRRPLDHETPVTGRRESVESPALIAAGQSAR